MPITGPGGFSEKDFMENIRVNKVLVLNNEQFVRICFCQIPGRGRETSKEKDGTALAGTGQNKTMNLVESCLS